MTNLVRILKHCPEGTKLYSPIFGEVTFKGISSSRTILGRAIDRDGKTRIVAFTRLGRFYCDFPSAECVLFPSKDQRDWSKFRIPTKKGDVIMFNGMFPCLVTGDYSKDLSMWCCGLLEDGEFIGNNPASQWNRDSYTFASEEVKNQLFTAMDKAGYTWDGETLKKKEPELKPFDKVLVRDSDDVPWTASYYSHKEEGSYPYITIGNLCFRYCIPFEGNEHLVGTTKNP